MSHRAPCTFDGQPIKAILFDRDGTLIHDVPYNGDPALVRPIDGMAEFVATARRAGLLLGVVTNQSGIARGYITHDQVNAVNAEVERLLGPFDTWHVCPHGPGDGCTCRKPAPDLLLSAFRVLDVLPANCLVVGDRSTDLAAAGAAGAHAVIVASRNWKAAMTRALRTESIICFDEVVLRKCTRLGRRLPFRRVHARPVHGDTTCEDDGDPSSP